ncbi:ABC transporter permease subunit [Nocardioides sp. R-C-SC26]|uniref:ABC transporter permease subunit n=1 Tax=Nocardioides sp. R-C-SC26 TaxID=2870414 RepID=UPI001E45243A|nr:ABC transporter permease subunit [Nocardioides sp. R-C-SC26]
MRRLLVVELNRLRWRRAIVVLLLAAAVIPLLLVGERYLTTSKPTAEDYAVAQQNFESELAYSERESAKCERKPERYDIDPSADDLAQRCRDIFYFPTSVEEYIYVERIDLAYERLERSGVAVAAMLGVVMFLIGTTFVGHDWNTGSMSNQLLFETRRLRVWAAKLVAVAAVALLACLVITTSFWLLMDLARHARGFDQGDGVLGDALGQGLRTSAMGAAAAAGGYLFTMLTRSTVFTLGVLFGVSVAGGVLLATVGPSDVGPVDPIINARAAAIGEASYYVEAPCEGDPSGSICFTERTRDGDDGAIYYGVVLAVVGAASVVSFRRRDLP